MKHRRRSLALRRNESLLSLAWVVIGNVATLLVRYMMAVRHLNPVKLIRDKQKRIYYTDAHGVVPVYPRWSERLVNLVISDNRRYRNILQWVQRNLPSHSITNFTSSWHDGIVLCSLLETLQPGVCPGSGHLKHHNRVNNCRLGIRLATQSLGLPQDMILPEEMAIADKTTELKILKYVSMIKWAAENKAFTNKMKNEITCAKKMTSCVAKGSGLEAGIIGKKMRFTLLVTDVVGMFHLNIDIKGPKNEIYNETIISLRQSSDLHQDNSSTALIKDRNPNPSIDERVMEFIEDGFGNSYVRWKNIKHFDETAVYDAIPFHCLCNGENTFLMGYTPGSAGIHTVSIRWQNGHINGSPFKVKVYQPLDATKRSVKEPTDKLLKFSAFSLSSIEEKGGSMDMIEVDSPSGDHNVETNSDKQNRSHRLTTKFRKEFTVTKRRVKRKVVSRNGEEIVIYESPSPTLSRQSSMTDSSTEDENRRRSRSTSPPSKPFVPHGRLSAVKRKSTTDNDILDDDNLRQASQTSCSSNGVLTENESEGHEGQKHSHLQSIVSRVGTFRKISEEKKPEKLNQSTTDDSSESQPYNHDWNNDSEKVINVTIQRSASDSALTRPIENALLKHKDRDLKHARQRGQKFDMNETASFYSSKIETANSSSRELRKLDRSWCEIDDRVLYNPLSSVSSTSSTTSNSSLELKQKTPLCGVHSLPTLDSIVDSEQQNMLRLKKMLRKNPRVVDSVRRKSRDGFGQKMIENTSSSPKASYEHTNEYIKNEVNSARRHNGMSSPKPKPDTYLIYPESHRTETTESPYMTGDSVEKQIHPVEPLEFNKDEKSSFDPEGRINNLHGLPGYSTGGTRRCRRRESMLKWIEDQTLTTGVHSEDTISATGFVDDEILGVKSNVIRQGDYREHPKDLSVSENDQTAKQGQTGKANKVHFDESKFCTKTIEYYSPSFDGVENPLRKVGLQRQMSVRSLNSKSSVYDTVCPDQKGIQSISTDSSENTDLLVKGRGMTVVGRTDRATQVLANEILQETKYLSFLCDFNIRRRKNCIKMPLKSDSRTDSLTRCFRPRSLSSDTSHEHLFEYRRRFIQGDRTNLGAFSDYGLDGQENHADSVDFPMRQSTIDTIDSGIADETSMKSIQTSPYFADDEHRSLNRHQKLFRKPYRGNIFLDPKLVMSNSNRNSPCSDKGSDDHSFESSVERSNFENGVSSRKSRRKASHKKDHNGDYTSLSDTEVTNASKAKFSISKYLSPTINKEKENISTEVPISPNDIPETPKVPHTSKIGIWCTACSKDESINESKSSTDEPGDLYGLSTNSRNMLLDNLANFRNLVVSPFRGLDGGIGSEFSSPLNSPRFNSESNHSCGMNSQTTFSSEISKIIKPVLFSFTNASSVTRFDEIKPGHYVSSIENMFLPISVGSSKSGSGSSYLDVSSSSSSEQKSSLEKNLSVKSPDSRVSSPLSQGSKLGTLSDSSIFSDMDKDDDLSDRKLIIDKDDDSDDDDDECKAEGLGLTQGQVGVKNNFQVWVESSRNSSLSVTIHGPRPHTVLESSVVYTGDNLYEVVFEVSHPGYYVICLRWAGKEIQDSPYLCRVTY